MSLSHGHIRVSRSIATQHVVKLAGETAPVHVGVRKRRVSARRRGRLVEAGALEPHGDGACGHLGTTTGVDWWLKICRHVPRPCVAFAIPVWYQVQIQCASGRAALCLGHGAYRVLSLSKAPLSSLLRLLLPLPLTSASAT